MSINEKKSYAVYTVLVPTRDPSFSHPAIFCAMRAKPEAYHVKVGNMHRFHIDYTTVTGFHQEIRPETFRDDGESARREGTVTVQDYLRWRDVLDNLSAPDAPPRMTATYPEMAEEVANELWARHNQALSVLEEKRLLKVERQKSR
ncbi:hypothetical protein N7535_004249 [Penicillium sp. DV-2018c]|nr:hypothetical protein N7461_000046 [Penicillium sp. DV-2018c]KAJ5577323.1 hypothetical protein N7535_004249 [Penicillium sp. DV-2018c]